MSFTTLPFVSESAVTETFVDSWASTPPAPVKSTDIHRLVEENLPLVRQAVNRLKRNLPAHVDADDLHSAGLMGLMDAAGKYDETKNQNFASYAMQRIRGSMLDELRKQDWCPRRMRTRDRKMQEATSRLEQSLGRSATDHEISRELGMTVTAIYTHREQMARASMMTLDQTVELEEGAQRSLHDLICDEDGTTGRDELQKQDMIDLLTKEISSLPERHQKLLALYYHENLRIAEIAVVFGVTESRVCQIHGKILGHLRSALANKR